MVKNIQSTVKHRRLKKTIPNAKSLPNFLEQYSYVTLEPLANTIDVWSNTVI